MIYFVVLLIEKQTGFVMKLGAFSHIYTMAVVILAWVFFRSANIASGCRYIGRMFGIGAVGFIDSAVTTTFQGTYVVLLLSFIGMTPLFAKATAKLEKQGQAWIESVWLVAVFMLSIVEIVSSSYNPFIYFNF